MSTDSGKRPTKPGQMVMIVGIEAHFPDSVDNSIIGITDTFMPKGTYIHPLETTVDGWSLKDCTRPTLAHKWFKVPNSCSTKNLVVIAGPDIDISEIEDIKLPEGELV